MSDVLRGREIRPRVTRKPSPGLAARMKMLEEDAEKRRIGFVGDAAAAAKLEIARSGPRPSVPDTLPLMIAEELAEGGGGVRNGVGGCAAGSAVTSIIHTYNSQPAALTDLPHPQPPQSNGAAKVRISDESPVLITSEGPSTRKTPSPTSSPHLSKQLPAHPTQEDSTLDDAETLPVLEETVADVQNHEESTYPPEEQLQEEQEAPRENNHLADQEQPEPQPGPDPSEIEQVATATEDGELHTNAPEENEEREETPPEIPKLQLELFEDIQDTTQEKEEEEPQLYSQELTPPQTEPSTPPGVGDNLPFNMAPSERPVTPPTPDAYPTETASVNAETETPASASSFDPYNAQSTCSTGTMLQRRASVYSLSRISFSAQLSRLTSLALPLSSEFSARIKRMETSVEVSSAITTSAKQILRWIETAKSVLKGLDSEDDVEWAAQGKKSLSEVDTAVGKFSSLMKVYVAAIDELQERPDAPSVGGTIFNEVVSTMETILDGWNEVQDLLKGVKSQVETAMEWNELWTTILQDIQAEIEACQTIVFEIEERRHRSLMEEGNANGGMDIDALATIVEEPHGQSQTVEDSSLLKLFARMQPLRASLDFLPMRLASFQSRAENIFPSACRDLELRRKSLEEQWKKLNSDAEEMRRELGEDKWVAIFRNAGNQATHMIDSVERSLRKLKEAVRIFKEGGELSTDLSINKKVESYEAKRVHYGPAIQRVLSIIDKGVSDRLTVNGEILRLHSAMQKRWKYIEQEMANIDEVLHELNLHASQQLRDSLSTIVSMDRSPASGIHTPGSSPASSIVLSSPAGTIKSNATVQRRSESAAGQYAKVSRGILGHSSTPPSSNTTSGPRNKHPPGRTTSNSISNVLSPTSSRGASPSPNSQRISVYHIPSPANSRRPSAASVRSTSSLDNRPRWNISVNTNDLDTGHNFKPLSLTTPSEYRKLPRGTLSTPGTQTRIPLPSPLKYGQYPRSSPSYNPIINSPTYKYSGNAGSKRTSIYGSSGLLKSPCSSPRSISGSSQGLDVPPRPELRTQHSMTNLSSLFNSGNRRPSMSSNQGDDHSIASTTAIRQTARPASAMAGGRRLSMLPRPRSPNVQVPVNSGGGDSAIPSGRLSRSKRNSMPPKSLQEKPRWRT